MEKLAANCWVHLKWLGLKDVVLFAMICLVSEKNTKGTHEAAIRNLLFQESSRSSHEGVYQHHLQTMITGFTRQLAPISFIKRLRTGIIQARLGLVSLCPHPCCGWVFPAHRFARTISKPSQNILKKSPQ